MEFGRKCSLRRAYSGKRWLTEGEMDREWERARVVIASDFYVFSSAGVCLFGRSSNKLADDTPLLLLIKDYISTLFPFMPIYWNNQYLHASLGRTSQNHMLSHWPGPFNHHWARCEETERVVGPYSNCWRNAKFLAIISVYWPGLHELFPTCWDSEIVCA